MESKKVELTHERLDCYRLAVAVANWAAEQRIPVARKHLRDQLQRAADSVVLNIAEATVARPRPRPRPRASPPKPPRVSASLGSSRFR